jgi:hypothetical protein
MILNTATTKLHIGKFSSYLDLDSCESDDLLCVNCGTLKLYLQVLTNEFKSAQQIVKILHKDRIENTNHKNQDSPMHQVHNDAVVKKPRKPKAKM